MTSVDSFKMYSKQVSKLMVYKFLGFVSIVMIALCFCFIMICHSLLIGSNYIDELCVDIELEKFVKENVDYFKQCVQVKLDGINYIINIKKILVELTTSFNEYRFAQFIKKEKYEYSSDEDELLSINNSEGEGGSEGEGESDSEGDLIDITEECKKIIEEKIKQEAIDLTESELVESLNDEDSAEEKAEEKEPLINKKINEFIDEHTVDEYDDFAVKTPNMLSSNDESD